MYLEHYLDVRLDVRDSTQLEHHLELRLNVRDGVRLDCALYVLSKFHSF